MQLRLEIAGDQIDGDRDYQEDAFLTRYLDVQDGGAKSAALLVMADGMGGHAAGNVASEIVVETFIEHFTAHFGEQGIPGVLQDALHHSNEAIRESVDKDPELTGMGCTVVAVVVEGGNLWWLSVGDSHLYLLRDGELTKLNADHSYGGFLKRMASLGTPVERDPDLALNMLVSAVMGEELTEVDNQDFPTPLEPGDRLIISSDGLDTLPPERLVEIAASAGDPDACVAEMLDGVRDVAKRRQDNTTVLVCDALEAAEPAEEAAVPPRVTTPDPYDVRERAPVAVRGAKRPGGRIAATLVPLAIVAGAVAAWLFLDFEPQEPATDAPVVEQTGGEEQASAVPDTQAVEETADEPEWTFTKFRDTLRSGGFGPQMVSLPGGSFMMGNRGSPYARERPYHEAEIPPFAMSVYEITFSEFDRYARAGGITPPDSRGLDRDTHPVFNVSWHDAVAYAEWLSAETGNRYALPSESQWEYAAAAGTDTPYWWGRQPSEGNAHCFRCNPGMPEDRPIPVGSFEPSPFGLYDTAGNIAEWVMDCFHPSYDGAPADGSVWQGGDCSVRVIRGGHYSSPNPSARARDTRDPGQGHPDVGIRVIREP